MKPAPPAPAPEAGIELGFDPFALVRGELAEVERELARGAGSDVAAIPAIIEHLRSSGGKRIRPALVLLAGQMCGCPPPARIRLAAVVEMLHAATLIHDDIIDEAPTRRGQPSTNARWGNARSVLAGDWLYMEAFRLALGERSFAILDALIALTQTMVEGELMQLEMQARVVSEVEHRNLIERKTARLFQVAAQLGPMAAGAAAAEVQALGRYGRHLGLAFQMVDDILDFTASAEVLGKPVGNDLREGKMTLPAIYAHAAASPAERASFERVLLERGYGSVSFETIRGLILRDGALERARRETREQAGLALSALEQFPDSPWQLALARLPEMVIERVR